MFSTTKPLSVTHPLTQVPYNTVPLTLVTELPGRLQTLFLPRTPFLPRMLFLPPA